MAELEIQVEGTPNPQAAKFNLSRPLPIEGRRSYFDAADAEGDPLAEELLAVEGVRALLMVDSFITVTKTEEARWEDLVDDLRGIIRRRLQED